MWVWRAERKEWLLSMFVYVNVCCNGNLRWQTEEHRHMFVCHATMRLLGAWRQREGGKRRRFLGRLFRTCMYKYPWKATFREPANQLTNQPTSHTQCQTFHNPHFPPHFLYFFPATRFDFISTCYLPSFTSKLGNITDSSCWLSITYALWSACFLKKETSFSWNRLIL